MKDSLSSVTLRQILEIFDLLVKNQDPDCSRTLYTYLFTKPSTSKRLESLMESAAAGKGLDEVIHLFESPMPNNTSAMDVSSIPQELEELLDEFDSPEEIVPETHENESEHGQEQHQEGDDDQDLPLTTGSQIDPSDAQNGGASDDETYKVEVTDEEVIIEGDGLVPEEAGVPNVDENNGKYTIPSTQSVPDCFQPHFCLCPICVATYIRQHNWEEICFRHAHNFQQASGRRQRQKVHLLHGRFLSHRHTISDFSTTFSFHEADDIPKDEPESESDPFINFELGEDGLDDEVDLVNHDDVDDENAQGSDVVTAITTTTSTTTTLHEDNEHASPDVDLGIDTSAQEPEDPIPGDEDELAEIDWREPLETVEETPGTPSGAGKRPRADDEDAGAEDEQGKYSSLVSISVCLANPRQMSSAVDHKLHLNTNPLSPPNNPASLHISCWHQLIPVFGVNQQWNLCKNKI